MATDDTPVEGFDLDGGQATRPAPRALHVIAREIQREWTNIYFGARPYLEAMGQLGSIEESYGYDPARHIVNYFLSNATHWRGPVARRIKLELNTMLAEGKPKPQMGRKGKPGDKPGGGRDAQGSE